MKQDLTEEIELPAGVSVQHAQNLIRLRGPKGEVSRTFVYPGVNITLEENKIVLRAVKATKREKRMLSTFAAHLKNLIKGVQEPYEYKLKICSGHFPMNVSIAGKEFTIKNFLGETVPRKFTIQEGAEGKISGTEIIVKSADKEIAGQTAASIEQLCRITNRDIRIFQDGCYITQKAGEPIA